MIGVVCSALAALTASLAAKRQHRHRPIAAALWVALAYAVAVELGSSVYAPRLTLVLWALAAVTSAWAYLDAWNMRGSWFTTAQVVLLVGGALVFGGPERWRMATWGPLGVSAVAGVVSAGLGLWAREKNERAVNRYFRREHDADGAPVSVHDLKLPEPFTITQRIALVLTASDVACLLFVPWPGVQIWQGRMSALVVAGMQVAWYLKNRRTV